MSHLIVTGIGTEVGKTVVSAILSTLLELPYWKPVQSGYPSDTAIMRKLIDPSLILPPAYSLSAPLSPHHAANLENRAIELKEPTTRCLIETAGGPCAPLSVTQTTLDVMQNWNADWIIVSRHYLGSINHTLLTVETLKRRGIKLLGLIFNGEPYPEGEEAILSLTQLPLLGHLRQEPMINKRTIARYVSQWKSGTLLHRCKQPSPLSRSYEVKEPISILPMDRPS